MGKLKNIVHLSKEQLETLLLTGKVTADGITVDYTSDDVHVIPIAEYDKFMTTNTQQVITGAKDFRGGITVNGEPVSRKLYKHAISVWDETLSFYFDLIIIYTSTSTPFTSLSALYNSVGPLLHFPVYDEIGSKLKIFRLDPSGALVSPDGMEAYADDGIHMQDQVMEV